MYVTRVPNRSSPPAVLLRESWREGGTDAEHSPESHGFFAKVKELWQDLRE